MSRATVPALLALSTLFAGGGCATPDPKAAIPSTAVFHHMASSQTPTVPSRQAPSDIVDPAAAFAGAMDAFNATDYERAESLCRGVIKSSPETPWQRRALFLLGRTFIARNSTTDAEATLLRVAEEYPDFGDYALFTLAGHMRSQGRPADAAELWQRLTTHYPLSLLMSRSLLLRGQALADAGSLTEAAAVYGQILRDHPGSDGAPDAALALGSVLAQTGDLQGAAAAFRSVRIKFPSVERDLAADRALADLAAKGIAIAKLNADELVERGRNQYRTGQFDRAASSFLAGLDLDPAHPRKAEILLRSGIALYNAGKRADAAATLDRLLKAKLPDCRCAEALHWIGKSYSRLGRSEEAVRSLLKLVRDYPDSSVADESLYIVGNVYRDGGDMEKALIYYRRLTAEYPDSSFADSALWWEGWNLYAAGDYRRARNVLGELIRRYPRSFLVNQALYWQGRAAEAADDRKAAAACYRRVLTRGPYTYYGPLAAQRLDGTMPVVAASIELPADPDDGAGESEAEAAEDDAFPEDGPPAWTDETIEVLSTNPSYRKTLELMYLGMKKEAAAELWSLLELMPGRSGAVLGLSKAFFDLGDYHSSIIVVLRHFDRMLERPSERIPNDLWLLAYPQGYWASITASARKFGLDPFFVAAIIREESQFRAEALSPAGARGVMQVMPATGEWIARNAGISGFERSRLFEADMNISIGTWYLAHLMKKFGGNLMLVSAAYNAGPEPVLNWASKAAAAADPAAFVETIPYAETRRYVKKVMRNYTEYRRIYAANVAAPTAGSNGAAERTAPAGAQFCRSNACP